jgi:hypothetical protein
MAKAIKAITETKLKLLISIPKPNMRTLKYMGCRNHL